jgi:hypothetical protein
VDNPDTGAQIDESAPAETTTAVAQPNGYTISSWLFQRVLAFVYLTAFGSLGFQIVGLIGHNGILPIDKTIEYMHAAGLNVFSVASLAFFNCTDTALQMLCWAGAAAACLLMAGVLPVLSSLLCWLLWLSIVNIGQDFLCFQWDILLLEAGFLSIFLAPWVLLDLPLRRNKGMAFATPYMVSIWLFQWLLFRLMLESGLCKLASGDATWRNLTAMVYHYHTQPLPTPLAWFADKLPEVLLKFSTFSTLSIELVFPFFIFVKKIRLVGAFFLMALQILIALTGNYTFFNLLTFAFCLFLIDDRAWMKALRFVNKKRDVSYENLKVQLPQKIGSIACSALIVYLGTAQVFASTFGVVPDFVNDIKQAVANYYLYNNYGLFAVMTTERNEIVLEGSMDGKEWRQYEFKYKPGNVFVPPCIVAPGQPRLDWQMWFAALGDISQSAWFGHFILRIFENSPDVLNLIQRNPFPGKAPEYLRGRLYRYTFSDWNELSKDGQWWRSEYKSDFLPTISRQGVHSQSRQVQ